MFTGIVEARVPVRTWEVRGEGARLVLPVPQSTLADPWDPGLGDSVAVSGCCLTIAQFDGTDMVFDLSAETIECTWFGQLEPGRVVNVERAMRIGDRLGGHLVSGHVDGGGEIVGIEDTDDGGQEFAFQADPGFERYLVEKGSVVVDGISLTIVRPRAGQFRVAIIPSTLEITSLGTAEVGQRVNLEADMVGKWIERLLIDREIIAPTA